MGLGVGVAVGSGMGVGSGVAVGLGVGTAVGLGVGVGSSVAVGLGVGVAVGYAVAVGLGVGVAVGYCVAVGYGVAVGCGVAVGLGIGVSSSLVGGWPTTMDGCEVGKVENNIPGGGAGDAGTSAEPPQATINRGANAPAAILRITPNVFPFAFSPNISLFAASSPTALK